MQRAQGETSNSDPQYEHKGLVAAQIISSFSGGGSERLAYNLVRAISRIATDSIAISLFDKNETLDSNGVRIIGLGIDRKKPQKLVGGLLRLRNLIRTHKITLLHVHGRGTLPFCVVALVGMRPRPLLWTTWHTAEDTFANRRVQRAVMRWSFDQCDKVFAASRGIVNKLTEHRWTRQHVTVFRNGVSQVEPSQCVDNPVPTILWMARIVPTKDLEILIRVANRLVQDGLRFKVVIAGDAPPGAHWYQERCEELVARCGMREIISFPGWIANTEDLIATAAIGVQTSLHEGLSMTLLEYMMGGLAIVATSVGDTAEALDAPNAGLLISPQNEDALYHALYLVVSNVGERQRLGKAARARALKHYSLGAMAKNVCFHYGSSVRDI